MTGTVQLYQPPAEYEDKSVVDAKLRERAAKGQLTRGKKRRRSVTAVPSGAGGGGIAAPERIQHGVYDLWGSAPEAAASASHAEDILPLAPNAAERQQRMQQEGRAGLPTDVPAVPLIAPGASYNPSFEDHQDLLGEETARQMALEATEVRVANAMEPRGSDGLVSDGSSDGEEEDDDDFLVSHPSGGEEPAAAGGATTVVTASKLTRAQLNKRARHAALRAQQAADAADRKLLRSLDHLETLQGLDKHAQRVERKNAARRKQRRAELLAARRSNPVRRKGSAPVYVPRVWSRAGAFCTPPPPRHPPAQARLRFAHSGCAVRAHHWRSPHHARHDSRHSRREGALRKPAPPPAAAGGARAEEAPAHVQDSPQQVRGGGRQARRMGQCTFTPYARLPTAPPPPPPASSPRSFESP